MNIKGMKSEINEIFIDSHKNNKIDFKNDFMEVVKYLYNDSKEVCDNMKSRGMYTKERLLNVKDEVQSLIDFSKTEKEHRTPEVYVKNMATTIDVVNNLMHSCMERKKELEKDENGDYTIEEDDKLDELLIDLGYKKDYFIQRLATDFNKNIEVRNSGAVIGVTHDKNRSNKKNTELFIVDLPGVGQLSWHISQKQEEALKTYCKVKDYEYDLAMNEKTSVKGLLLSQINVNDLKEHQKIVINSKGHNMKKNLNQLYLNKDER